MEEKFNGRPDLGENIDAQVAMDRAQKSLENQELAKMIERKMRQMSGLPVQDVELHDNS